MISVNYQLPRTNGQGTPNFQFPRRAFLERILGVGRALVLGRWSFGDYHYRSIGYVQR